MAIKFPKREEVKLGHPPLVEVVCQVRFPPILRLAQEEPDELQELIHGRFPQLTVEQGIQVQFPPVGNQTQPETRVMPKLFRFQTADGLTADGLTAVSLTIDFFAVSTKAYTGWHAFAQDLAAAYAAISQIYPIPYATRIGLRYVNQLTLPNTGQQTKKQLLALLRPELTATLQGDVWEDVDEMLCQMVFTENQAQLNVRFGYQAADGQPAILLDFDYFEQGKLQLDNLVERGNQYHATIYDGFRWCLQDSALSLFQPVTEGVQ